MKEILSKLSGFFKEEGGQLSSMRLILVAWAVGTFLVWATLSLIAHSLLPIPPTILAFLTSLIGGKLIQNNTEK